MQLIGMLDSPYVRRTAITLIEMGLPFEHRALSVFRNVAEFKAINPVIKAPTLVLDDGSTLMDSTLIIEHLEALAPAGRSLMPTGGQARVGVLRLLGLALAASEKCVQLLYERQLRPTDRQHQPWIERLVDQRAAAFDALEKDLDPNLLWLAPDRPSQAGITAAVAWRFSDFTAAGEVTEASCPRLAALSRRAESLPSFTATPLD